jgi:hypothetical protein
MIRPGGGRTYSSATAAANNAVTTRARAARRTQRVVPIFSTNGQAAALPETLMAERVVRGPYRHVEWGVAVELGALGSMVASRNGNGMTRRAAGLCCRAGFRFKRRGRRVVRR